MSLMKFVRMHYTITFIKDTKFLESDCALIDRRISRVSLELIGLACMRLTRCMVMVVENSKLLMIIEPL